MTPAEVAKVVNYLALNLGPGINLPPARAVSLPDVEGKQSVETRCGLCYDLERITAVKRRKAQWPLIVANMTASSATASPEKSKTISNYLAANFGN